MRFITFILGIVGLMAPVQADWDLVQMACDTGLGDGGDWDQTLAVKASQAPCSGVPWANNWGQATMESGNPCNNPDTLLYTREGANYKIAVKARPGIRIGTCYPRNQYISACNGWNFACGRLLLGWCQSSYCN